MAEGSTRSIRARRESVESVSRFPVGMGGGAAAAGTGDDPEVGLGDWIVTLTVGALRRRAPQPPQLRKPRSSAAPVTGAPQRGHLGVADKVQARTRGPGSGSRVRVREQGKMRFIRKSVGQKHIPKPNIRRMGPFENRLQ